MPALPMPAADELLVPASIRADGGVHLGFARCGQRTLRMQVAESGGYRARFPDTFDNSCEAVLINTGGGMAGGDRMRVAVAAGEGADVVLTTQAAEKIYRSQGFDTTIETSLTVGSGARVTWIPQETILFSESRLRRSLTVDLAPDARLVACETTFFGRSAMGECLERAFLRDRWRLRRGSRLVFAEDLRLEGPAERLLARPAIAGGARAVATMIVAGSDLAGERDAVRALLAESQAVEGGAGIVADILVVRLLSTRADALRRALVTLLGQVTGRALPRTWSS